jgi:hypothetical protein
MTILNKKFVAPALPTAPPDYDQQRTDQLNYSLRGYFNNLDNWLGNLTGSTGGREIGFPHISASDSTDQYATASDTPTVVKFDTLDSGSGWTLSAPGSATPDQTGIYKVTYSVQVVNTDSTTHDAVFWLKLNGVDVPNSATSFSIPPQGGGGLTYICAYSEATFTVSIASVVELYWATEQAATSGGGLGVYLFADPAQTTPYERPAIPSVIGSITFVSSV